MFKYVKNLFLVTCLVVSGAVQSFAAMAPADVTATTTGISDAMALFYTIGGSILVVCAAIWGFKRVKALLG
jgi:hypothetical protein